MNWSTVIEALWRFLNMPLGITVVAGGLLWLLNRTFNRRPAWQAYEGTIIAAVKWAEKEIPDDTPNKSFQRLNAALNYVLKVYQEARGFAPEKALKESIKEGIQIVHAELEASGNISPRVPRA